MEGRPPNAPGSVIRPPQSPRGPADLAVVSPPVTIDDPNQHHCADHARFHPDCEVCKRACANFRPYPVRYEEKVSRSFGFKDDLTESKLRELDPKLTNLYADDSEFSLSLTVIRFLFRLIWPFRQ
jgi:hypothetical protein